MDLVSRARFHAALASRGLAIVDGLSVNDLSSDLADQLGFGSNLVAHHLWVLGTPGSSCARRARVIAAAATSVRVRADNPLLAGLDLAPRLEEEPTWLASSDFRLPRSHADEAAASTCDSSRW